MGNPGGRMQCVGERAPWVPGRGERADAGEQGAGERAVWVPQAGSGRCRCPGRAAWVPPALCGSAPLGKAWILPYGVMHQARLSRPVMGTKNQGQLGMRYGVCTRPGWRTAIAAAWAPAGGVKGGKGDPELCVWSGHPSPLCPICWGPCWVWLVGHTAFVTSSLWASLN